MPWGSCSNGHGANSYNRSLRNKKLRFEEKRSFLNKEKPKNVGAKGALIFDTPNPKKLEIFRKTYKRERKRALIIRGLVWFSFSVVVFFFFRAEIGRIMSGRKYIAPEELKKRKNDSLDFNYYLNDGDVWMKKQHWHNAIFQYKEALNLFPYHEDARYKLFLAYSQRCHNENIDCDKTTRAFEEYIVLED